MGRPVERRTPTMRMEHTLARSLRSPLRQERPASRVRYTKAALWIKGTRLNSWHPLRCWTGCGQQGDVQ